jgi:2,4-dienoyl-CoA reductase (NADPH2)
MLHQAEDRDYATSLLRSSGRRVTVIDMLPRLAGNVGKTARWSLMKSLKLLGVNLRPGTKLLEIKEDAVVVETGNGQETIPADTVVMAAGVSSVRSLAEAVQDTDTELIEIGDAKKPGKITEAIRQGFLRALEV